MWPTNINRCRQFTQMNYLTWWYNHYVPWSCEDQRCSRVSTTCKSYTLQTLIAQRPIVVGSQPLVEAVGPLQTQVTQKPGIVGSRPLVEVVGLRRASVVGSRLLIEAIGFLQPLVSWWPGVVKSPPPLGVLRLVTRCSSCRRLMSRFRYLHSMGIVGTRIYARLR